MDTIKKEFGASGAVKAVFGRSIIEADKKYSLRVSRVSRLLTPKTGSKKYRIVNFYAHSDEQFARAQEFLREQKWKEAGNENFSVRVYEGDFTPGDGEIVNIQTYIQAHYETGEPEMKATILPVEMSLAIKLEISDEFASLLDEAYETSDASTSATPELG